MDYTKLKDIISPLLSDNRSVIESSKTGLYSLKPDDSFEQNILAVLKSIHKTIETNEALKQLAKTILDHTEHFSDTDVHHSTKSQTLKQILQSNKFVETNKSFNLSTLQTYMDSIVQKQLYEINIKIEENQRALNNLSSSSAQSTPKPSPKTKELPDYLLLEHEQEKCALLYDNVVQILQFDAPFTSKNLSAFTMLYGKICGPNQQHVIKEVQETTISKNQVLGNANMTLKNTEAKNFAVIVQQADELNIFFIDYLLYTTPVKAEKNGEFIVTSEGNYKFIEV